MYIPRMAETAIASALETFLVVVLTGARQSGKSTTLREKFGRGRRTASLDAFVVSSSPISGEVAPGIFNLHWSRL